VVAHVPIGQISEQIAMILSTREHSQLWAVSSGPHTVWNMTSTLTVLSWAATTQHVGVLAKIMSWVCHSGVAAAVVVQIPHVPKRLVKLLELSMHLPPTSSPCHRLMSI
jgi:hypothetical protein